MICFCQSILSITNYETLPLLENDTFVHFHENSWKDHSLYIKMTPSISS